MAKKLLIKFGKFIVNALTLIVFALLIVVIVAKVLMLANNEEYLKVFGYSIFNVATGSMEPAINVNDIVIVKKVDKYSKDDIITYKKDNDYITHRIISINENYIITKGDANNTSDETITSDQVIGKVVKIYSNLGIWQHVLTTPSVYVAIFITLLAFDFAFSFKGFNNLNKDAEEIKVTQLESVKKDKVSKKVLNSVGTETREYTIRLDLNRMQKEIDDKLKPEDK